MLKFSPKIRLGRPMLINVMLIKNNM